MDSNKVLITGGAGYIGSHCALSLIERGFNVVICDNLSTGNIETIETIKSCGNLTFYNCDLTDTNSLFNIFKMEKFDAVIHFAAFSQVGESVLNPQKYYLNNVGGTLNLLNAMLNYNVKKIVFSSSAAVYGEPKHSPISEEHSTEPINPYGQSKLIVEKILDDYDKAYKLRSVRLRYFNVIGTDKFSRIGECHNPETHLIPNILISSFENNKTFEIFGNDYNTNDGTCIRDYIDINDLVEAHILALNYLNKDGKTVFLNLGTNCGKSVKEIFNICEKVLNKKIIYKICPRRIGDPEKLIADNKKAYTILNWQPKHTLENSISSAYSWIKKQKENEHA